MDLYSNQWIPQRQFRIHTSPTFPSPNRQKQLNDSAYIQNTQFRNHVIPLVSNPSIIMNKS